MRFVVPGDPDQNTGGYRYVKRLSSAIASMGVETDLVGLPGSFPRPDATALREMDQYLSRCPDQAVVVLDGLAMSGMPEIVERHSQRLALIALIHHPLADESGLTPEAQGWFFDTERRALAAVNKVITTSPFTARRLADFGVSPQRIAVAEPGVATADIARKTQARAVPTTPRILCVGHLSPRKAQHQLVAALRELQSLDWHCTLVGALDRDAAYSRRVAHEIESAGLHGRIELAGEADDEHLVELYRNADLFVFPSLYEGYGMVIDEAVAAGLPIISSDGGALAETAKRPGAVQYPAGDIEALTDRLRIWLADSDQLAYQTELARQARPSRTWHQAAEVVLAIARAAAPASDTVFDGSWLALREGADHRARSLALTHSLNQWLQQSRDGHDSGSPEGPITVVDLGAGRGSNALFLSPRLTVPQRWRLLDHDAALLAEAGKRLEQADVPASVDQCWLTAETLPERIPQNATLITASALIDLVSEPWLEALVSAAAARRAALLVVLSYSGQFRLNPSHADDDRLLALVNQHQQGEKGTGQALGPAAPQTLAQGLERAGYAVETASSPWHLDGKDEALVGQLLQGWVTAALQVAEGTGEDSGWLQRWLADRRRQLATGELAVTVGHLDLLAIPEVRSS